jgi:2'-5' RNA ligase
MAEPARIRSFIAVDPAAATRAALVRLKADLAAIRADVRWVGDEALHCTLKFLGGVAPERLERVHDAVRTAAAAIEPGTVSARGLGAFPSLKRARVVWAGFDGDCVRALAAAIEGVLQPLGFETERRAFHPHITLGRVNGTRGWERVRALIDARAGDDFGRTTVDSVVIYRSDLRRTGAEYTALWRLPLAKC